MPAYLVSRPVHANAPVFLSNIIVLSIVIGTLFLLLFPSSARAGSGSAFVRVNQMGYATNASKRAYLMATGVETGATFHVKNASGATVFSAPLGANLGSWSSTFPNVYALDFDAVKTPGTYTIVTSGSIPGSSPRFTIDTATNVYASALSNALSFYENERDGSNFIP